MTSKKEKQDSEEQKDGSVRLEMVRPESISDEDLRVAAKRLFEALTGKSADEGDEENEESESEGQGPEEETHPQSPPQARGEAD